MYSAYKPRIQQSRSTEQAATHAAAFLTQAGCMFDEDITQALHSEAERLWARFPARVRTVEKYKELVQVLLGQAVDFYWYADFPHYQTDHDVKTDGTLYSFGKRDANFDVKFTYVQYFRHILMRVPNSLRLRYRRFVNHPGRYTQGLTTTRCKRAVAGLINQLSEDVANETGPQRPFKLMVNSVLRTVAYQDALARIGYVAPRHSAHLAGYAVDVEKLWYEKHDERVHQAIVRLTGDLFEKEVINLIEEGTHWHICLNPDHIPFYEALSAKWERNAR
jgi:hypothetical protein